MILKEFLEKVKDLPLDTEIDKWCPNSGYHHIKLEIEHNKEENKYYITV